MPQFLSVARSSYLAEILLTEGEGGNKCSNKSKKSRYKFEYVETGN